MLVTTDYKNRTRQAMNVTILGMLQLSKFPCELTGEKGCVVFNFVVSFDLGGHKL